MTTAPAVDPAPVPVQGSAGGATGRPRYLFFCPWPVRPGTGVNNVVVGLSGALKDRYQPEIVVTGWDPPPLDELWLKLPAVEFSLRKLPGYILRFFPNLMRLLRLSRGAAAINAHYFGSEVLPIVLLRRAHLIPKLILSVHGADITEASRGNLLDRALYRFICHQADIVVACSEALGGELRKLAPRARVVPIWNGVSPAPIEFGPPPIADPYLVSVAAFVRKKGHDVLLEAFRQIAPEFPDLKLILIGGDGPERAAVEHQIRSAALENRVQVIVNLEHDRVWDWMHHARSFVHAAREEPFGIAVLEAALARTPVIATSVGGVREYLINGVNGLTCSPDDPVQLAARIRDTLRDPAQARVRAAAFREKASSFTWEAAWERYRAAAGL